jgi:hypothetical protein
VRLLERQPSTYPTGTAVTATLPLARHASLAKRLNRAHTAMTAHAGRSSENRTIIVARYATIINAAQGYRNAEEMDHRDSCLPERSLQHFWTIISRPCVEPALGRTASRRRTINFGTELCYLKPNLRCGKREIT